MGEAAEQQNENAAQWKHINQLRVDVGKVQEKCDQIEKSQDKLHDKFDKFADEIRATVAGHKSDIDQAKGAAKLSKWIAGGGITSLLASLGLFFKGGGG
jgi:predicted nuclease with TOPRIM domain